MHCIHLLIVTWFSCLLQCSQGWFANLTSAQSHALTVDQLNALPTNIRALVDGKRSSYSTNTRATPQVSPGTGAAMSATSANKKGGAMNVTSNPRDVLNATMSDKKKSLNMTTSNPQNAVTQGTGVPPPRWAKCAPQGVSLPEPETLVPSIARQLVLFLHKICIPYVRSINLTSVNTCYFPIILKVCLLVEVKVEVS